MSKIPWPQFRAQLFSKMEERRSKIAIFRIEQIYWFVHRCSKLWTGPETKEGQEALNVVAEEGTFLLVADSFTEFCDLFPAVAGEEATTTQPTQLPSHPPQPTPDARQRSGSPFRQ